MAITIRPARPDDIPFLQEMFVEAANWDPSRPFQPLDRLLDDVELRRYIEGWGRAGDVGFIAEDDGAPIGAAWRRSYPSDAPGYGFLSEGIPEITIGVRPERRGEGVGARLLAALAGEARGSGLMALSLSVETGNRALRLYLREGYRVIRSSAEDHVLRLDLG